MVLGGRLRKGVLSLQTAIQTPKGHKKETFDTVDDDLSSVLLGEQDDFQTQSYTSKSTYGSIYNNRSIRESKGTNDALGTSQFVKVWKGTDEDDEDDEENNDIWGVNHDQRILSEFEALNSLGTSKHKSAREHNINSSPPSFFSTKQQLKNSQFTPHYTTPSFELPAELRRPSVSSRSRQRGDTMSESGSVMSNHSSSTITTKQGYPVVPSSPRTPTIPTTPGRSTYMNSKAPSPNQHLRTPGRQQPTQSLFQTPTQSARSPGAYPTPSRTANSFLALVDHGDWGELAKQSAKIEYTKSPDRKPRHLDAIRQLRLSRVDDSDDSSSEGDEDRNNSFDAFDDDDHESDPLIEFSDEESIASLAVTADDKPEVISRKVSRMTSGQLRRWDGFESQVTRLVNETMPQHVNEIPKLMHKFAGREAELMQTLQGMANRSPWQRSRANIPKSKGIKGVRRVYAVQMDAVAIIAAACTLDDQLQAVKPEFVVDEGHPGRNHDDDDSTESDEDSQYYDSEESSSSEEEYSSDGDHEEEEEDEDSTIYSEEDSSDESSYDTNDEEVETTADTFWNGYR